MRKNEKNSVSGKKIQRMNQNISQMTGKSHNAIKTQMPNVWDERADSNYGSYTGSGMMLKWKQLFYKKIISGKQIYFINDKHVMQRNKNPNVKACGIIGHTVTMTH